MWRRSAIFFLLLNLALTLSVGAQNCAPDSIVLTTQAEVDDFQVNHGPCTQVVGALSIEGPDIVNLDGLSSLTSIGSSLSVEDTESLVKVDLPGLTTLGDDLFLVNNSALTSFSLAGLTAVGVSGYLPGNVLVFGNDALKTLALPNLTSIRREIEITNNDALLAVDLPELTTLRTVRMENNASLTTVSLPSIETLEGNLTINEHPALASVELSNLTTVNGRIGVSGSGPLQQLSFPQLVSVFGSLGFGSHPNLRVVDLPSLERAATDPISEPIFGLFSNPSLETLLTPRLEVVRFIQIDDCGALTRIDLPALDQVFVDVFITGNEGLQSVSMPAITFVGSGLLISGNPSLSQCCGLLPALAPDVVQQFITINNNAPGCNSVEEIEEVCTLQIPTAGQWGLALLTALLALAGVAAIRRTSAGFLT